MKKQAFISMTVLAAVVASVIFIGLLTDKQEKELQGVRYACPKSIPADYVTISDVAERKKVFFETLLPLVLRANQVVTREREDLEDLSGTKKLKKDQKRTLEGLAVKYRVKNSDTDELIAELEERVDVLPVSLVLAQAAIESGWGTSRFALEGNNLFGLRTSSGSGMVPTEREAGRTFRVSVFDDLQSCIDYYLWTINTHPVYSGLRRIRAGQEMPYDSVVLAAGLEGYSEIGYAYVDKVIGLIEYNDLRRYDSCLLDDRNTDPDIAFIRIENETL